MRIPGRMAGECVAHIFVPEFSPKGHMALHPPYNRVKAIGAIASHQLWTIGLVALPHTSHRGGGFFERGTTVPPSETLPRTARGRYRGTSLIRNRPLP